jgi:hypothetical protein
VNQYQTENYQASDHDEESLWNADIQLEELSNQQSLIPFLEKTNVDND